MKLSLVLLFSLIYIINNVNSKKSCLSYDENECLNNKDECYLSKISSCCEKDFFMCLPIPSKFCQPEEISPQPIIIDHNKHNNKHQQHHDNLLDEKQIVSQNNHEWCLKKKKTLLKFNSSCVPDTNNVYDYFKPNKYKCKFTKCLKGFKCIDNDHNEFHRNCDSLTNPCCSYQSKCIPTKDAHPLDVPIHKKPRGNELKEMIYRNLNPNIELVENHNKSHSPIGDNNSHHNKKKKSYKNNQDIEIENVKHNTHHNQDIENKNYNQTNANDHHKKEKHNTKKHHDNPQTNHKHNKNHKVHIKKDDNNNNHDDNKSKKHHPKNDISKKPHSTNSPKSLEQNHTNDLKENQDNEDLNNVEEQKRSEVPTFTSFIDYEKQSDNSKGYTEITKGHNFNPNIIYKDPIEQNNNLNNNNDNNKNNEKEKEKEKPHHTLNPVIFKDPNDNINKPHHTINPNGNGNHLNSITNDNNDNNGNHFNPRIIFRDPLTNNNDDNNNNNDLSKKPYKPPLVKTLLKSVELDQSPTSKKLLSIDELEDTENIEEIKKLEDNDKKKKKSKKGKKNKKNDNKNKKKKKEDKNNKTNPPKKTNEPTQPTSDVPIEKTQPPTPPPTEKPTQPVPQPSKPSSPPNPCATAVCGEGSICFVGKDGKAYCKLSRFPSKQFSNKLLLTEKSNELNCQNLPCPEDQICYIENLEPKCKPKPKKQTLFYENDCESCPADSSTCLPRTDGKTGVVCTVIPITCAIVQCQNHEFCMDNTEDLQPHCYDKMDCSLMAKPEGYTCVADNVRGAILIKNKESPSLNCSNLPCANDQICFIEKSIPKCKTKPKSQTTFYEKNCSSCPPNSSSCEPRDDGKQGVICKVNPITCAIVQCEDNQFCMDNTEDMKPHCYNKMNCLNTKPPKGYKCIPDNERGGIFAKK